MISPWESSRLPSIRLPLSAIPRLGNSPVVKSPMSSIRVDWVTMPSKTVYWLLTMVRSNRSASMAGWPKLRCWCRRSASAGACSVAPTLDSSTTQRPGRASLALPEWALILLEKSMSAGDSKELIYAKLIRMAPPVGCLTARCSAPPTMSIPTVMGVTSTAPTTTFVSTLLKRPPAANRVTGPTTGTSTASAYRCAPTNRRPFSVAWVPIANW